MPRINIGMVRRVRKYSSTGKSSKLVTEHKNVGNVLIRAFKKRPLHSAAFRAEVYAYILKNFGPSWHFEGYALARRKR